MVQLQDVLEAVRKAVPHRLYFRFTIIVTPLSNSAFVDFVESDPPPMVPISEDIFKFQFFVSKRNPRTVT